MRMFYLFSWWVIWAKLGTSVRILHFTDLAGGVCGRNFGASVRMLYLFSWWVLWTKLRSFSEDPIFH